VLTNVAAVVLGKKTLRRFDVSPCTPTTNTKCTKQFALSNDVLAGIIIAVLVPVVLLVFSLAYIRYRTKLIVTRTQLGDTKNFLELTERLLGDEREENALMAQGWRIAEDDLVYETVIGEGAFGRVYRGTWGHIQVAIKVLLLYLAQSLCTRSQCPAPSLVLLEHFVCCPEWLLQIERVLLRLLRLLPHSERALIQQND
jgi:hypothetical protein